MLYFGDGSGSGSWSPGSRNMYTPGPRLASGSHSTGAGGGSSGSAAGFASGRDASGYLSTGMGRNNILNGTYSSVTYGGSLQYNFAGPQG